MKYLNFNPDFFIKKSEQVVVVEIKDDKENANETRAKLRDATKHFVELNLRQGEYEYIFLMLGPQDYENFFIALTNDCIKQYQSTLMERLDSYFSEGLDVNGTQLMNNSDVMSHAKIGATE